MKISDLQKSPETCNRDGREHLWATNLNQSVKRAYELAVAGLLPTVYFSQVLMPEIENTQKILNTLYQELTKITQKAASRR